MILVTGFGPFDIFPSNPSQVIAEMISGEFEGCEHRILPVVFGKARSELERILCEFQPDTIVSFGLNGTISHIALEVLAANLRYSEVPDNEGVVQRLSRIDPDGPLALESTLPLEDILSSLREEGIPSRLSFSAGAYLCNETFYTVMRYCERTGAKGGFVHIPIASHMVAPHPRLGAGPHMPIEMMLKASRIVLRESLNRRSSPVPSADGRSSSTCKQADRRRS